MFDNNSQGRYDGVNNTFSLLVTAPEAIFTEPISRGGGERLSYLVPTYSALVGVCSANYWKPTISYRVKRVRVLKPIQMETKAMLYPRLYTCDKPGDADRAFTTYLRDVAYQIEGKIIWNEERPDLMDDRDMRKHMDVFRRALIKGGRHYPYLGKREDECYGYISPCEFGEGTGAYDYTKEMSFGLMLHSIIYPTKEDKNAYAQFWMPKMEYGVINFPTVDECPSALRRKIKLSNARSLEHLKRPVQPVNETWKEMCSE